MFALTQGLRRAAQTKPDGISPRFAGHDKLARHRMIYAALGSLMQREIHALAIRAFAPDEL